MKKVTPVSILELLPVILAILLAVTIFVFNGQLPNQLPLFYSLPWGDNQLARREQLYILPAMSAAIALINLIIYWHLKAPLLRRTLLISSLLITGILIITYFKVIFLFV